MLIGFTINNSMNVVLAGGESDMYDFAIEYSFKEVQHGNVPNGAEPFNAMRCYPEGRESAEFYVMALSPDSAGINLRDSGGNNLSKDQVNITYPLASRLKLKVGDSITFINKLDGKSYSLAIDAVVETYSGQFIFMPLDRFNSMAGMPPGSYSGLLSNRILDIDERLLAGVKDMHETNDSMDDLAAPMMSMIITVTVVAGLMGIIIIYLVTSLVIEESRGTISLLKVFGYRGKEVAGLILNGSTWVVIAGFLLGLPLMFISGNALYGYLGEMVNLVLPMIISPLYVLISFVVIIAVYYLTRKLCGRKLSKISMNEALKAGAE